MLCKCCFFLKYPLSPFCSSLSKEWELFTSPFNCVMVTFTLSPGLLARKEPVYHCRVYVRKINLRVHSWPVGHGSVRCCSLIMMFDQGNSRFSNGVNELMRMTLTQSPFCFSVEPSLLRWCLGCGASAFILLHRHGSSRLLI